MVTIPKPLAIVLLVVALVLDALFIIDLVLNPSWGLAGFVALFSLFAVVLAGAALARPASERRK